MIAEATKLQFKEMTRQKLYDIFNVKQVDSIQDLEDWLNTPSILDEKEKTVIQFYQEVLLKNVSTWNKQELLMGFVGPIFNLINFKIPYQLNFFAKRYLTTTIGEYEFIGEVDSFITNGYHEPEAPYLSFQIVFSELPREIETEDRGSGDPAGQNLAAMLVGQKLNEGDEPIYGCFVVGRHWHFMILKGNEFTISKSYAADDDEIFDILKILKSLKAILFKRINYTPKEN